MRGFLVREEGSARGPYTKEEILERHRCGDLPGTALTWREGENGWTPISRRWRTSGRPPGLASFLLLFAIVGTLAVATLTVLGLLPQSMHLQYEPIKLAAVVVGALAFAITLTLAYIKLVRGRLGQLTLGPVTCSLLCAASSIFLGTLLVQAFQLERLLADHGNASITFDPSRAAIVVSGEIGPSFLTDLRRQLESNPHARTMVITSPGGLLDVAVEAAAWIKDSALVLRADGECASACVVLWAAAPVRQATPSTQFGFHQSRSIGIRSQVVTALNLRDSERQIDDRLQQAGFSNDLIAVRRETKPEDMYWVFAVSQILSDVEGTITDAQGAPMSEVEARLRLVRSLLGDKPYGRLLEAFLPFADQALAAHVPAVYDAAIADDVPAYDAATGILTDAMRLYALQHAPDQAVVELMHRRYRRLTADHGRPDPVFCDVFNGQGGKDSPAYVEAVRAFFHDIELLADAMATPTVDHAQRGGVRRGFSPEDFIADRYAYHVAALGYPSEYALWTNLQRCAFTGASYQAASALGVREQADLVRVLDGVEMWLAKNGDGGN